MQKHTLLFTIILNLLSTAVWGEDFLVNYYHKGVIVHTQRVVQGSAIGSLPDLNLVSCNDEIPLFAGWITENDVNKYENVINKLSQSKNNDLTEILRVCENTNNEYLKCVKCESLIMLEEFAKARMIIHSLKIDTSLKQYFINLINSYEVDL